MALGKKIIIVKNATAYTWDWYCHLVVDRASFKSSLIVFVNFVKCLKGRQGGRKNEKKVGWNLRTSLALVCLDRVAKKCKHARLLSNEHSICKCNLFCYSLPPPGASGGCIRTLELRYSSQMFYHSLPLLAI